MNKILFYNARIWRKNGDLYSWMVFDSKVGNILQCGVGRDSPLVSCVHEAFDMKQRWVFPGFHDSHLHISDTGQFADEKFNLNLPKTKEEFKDRLRVMASRPSSKGEWLVGYGWDHNVMGEMPTCDDLDEVIPDRPVLLHRVCLHIAVVNSAMMSLVGITNETKDPENGCIGRYPAGHQRAGKVNGVLSEDGGVQLVLNVMPSLTMDQKKANILAALKRCLNDGITSVHTCDDLHWNAYVDLARSNLLPIHCYCSPYSTNFGTSNFPSKAGENYKNLTCNFVKVFMDGALRTETAALSVPFLNKNEDGTDNYGIMQKSDREFEELYNKINDAGFRIEIHVIGDRAAEVALNLLEKCGITPEKRPVFVHCQLLNDELVDRMVKCGVVPTIQPSFVPTDASWVNHNLPDKLKSCMYPWKTLLNRGIICGGSSDSPVETTDPLQGIYDAIFRVAPDGKTFVESECLTFVEAVGLYTTGSAYADGVERSKGQLEVGFRADIVVLDVPLNENGIPGDLPKNPKLLKDAKIREVWVGGLRMVENL